MLRRARRGATPALALVVALAAAGCSGGTAGDVPATDASARPVGADATEPLDVAPLDCETLGFPCAWSEVEEDVRRNTIAVLAEAGMALQTGRTTDDVAAEIASRPDVAAVVADATGVQLRLRGGPVVVAHHPLTVPPASAMVDALAPGGGTAVGLPDQAGPPGVVAAQAGEVVPYEPTRDPDLRPRSALVVRPWEAHDAIGIFTPLQDAGLIPADAAFEDVDLDLVGLGNTVGALEASEHITTVRDDTDAAFVSFAAHDLVYVQTHSSSFGAQKGCDPGKGHVCGQILGGPPFAIHEEGQDSPYDDVAFTVLDDLPRGATIGFTLGSWTTGYTPDFFRSQYASGLDSIVILNACSSGGDPSDASLTGNVLGGLADVATASAGPAVFGWSDFANAFASDQTAAILVDLLLSGGVSARTAFEAIDEVPTVREHEVEKGDGVATPRLVRGGRDLRLRDAIELRHSGTTMTPGTTVAVAGTVDDGAHDVIRELVVRVDGVVEGQEDAAKLTWQVLGRHDDPVVVDDPFENGPGRFVREVDTGTLVDDPQPVPRRWRSHQIRFTELPLGFDLEEADVAREVRRPQQLQVTIDLGDGRPSRHLVQPVHFQLGLVEVLDPDLGRPLGQGDRVVLDGQADDGAPEPYPLVVRMEYLDPEDVPGLVLEVAIGDTTVSIPGDEWEALRGDRYWVEREVELPDFEEPEREVPVRATIEVPEVGSIGFLADPVALVLEPSRDCVLDGTAVSAALGRPFDDPEGAGGMSGLAEALGNFCLWQGERSTVSALVVAGGGDAVRATVAGGSPDAVDGYGDAAHYDLESGNALHPSGIEQDGAVQWNNFVVLTVAVGEDSWVFTVAGNIVVEEGPEAGLPDRLRSLVAALRDP